MSLWKDGLLVAAGGLAGLALAALLESEEDIDDDCPKEKLDGLELMVKKVRDEAEWTMEECVSDEEREKVYEKVSAAIKKLQGTLQKRGEEIVADLRDQAADDEMGAAPAERKRSLERLNSAVSDLTDSLDETLISLKPKNS